MRSEYWSSNWRCSHWTSWSSDRAWSSVYRSWSCCSTRFQWWCITSSTGWIGPSWWWSNWWSTSMCWAKRSDKLCPLWVNKDGISISVHSSNDGKKFHLRSIMSSLSKERAYIYWIDSSTVVSINRSECSIWAVIILDLELSFQSLKSSLKINFLLNDSCNCKFNISWKIIISSNSSCSSVKSNVSQEVVFAW